MKGFRKPSLWTLATLVLAISMATPWTALAYVSTDKPDYAPGETVTISGDSSNFEPGVGYVPGETVEVEVYGPNGYYAVCLAPDPQNPDQGLPVIVAGDGSWSCQVTLWGDDRAIGQYTYIATGQNMSETGTFTDGVVDVDINSPTSGAWVTVTSLPATIPIGFRYQTTMFGTSTGEAWVLGTGAYGSAVLDNNLGLPADASINVTIPAGTTNGPYNVKAVVTNDWGSPWPYSSSQSDEQSGAVRVCLPTSVTTQPTDQSVVYGTDAYFTVAGSNYTSIQWMYADNGIWSPIQGANAATLTLASPTVSMNYSQYRAVLDTGCGGIVWSNAAMLTVTPADATCTISGYSGPYDGSAHGATGTCTGVGGVDLSSGLTFSGSYINVPGSTAYWSFSYPNYASESGSVPIEITPADATCTISGYSGPYDGTAHGVIGTCTGVGGVDLSSGVIWDQSFTDVPGGTAQWLFSYPNYAPETGRVPVTITPGNATCAIDGYTVVYDGQWHLPTGTCTGVAGEDLSSYLNLSWGAINVPGGDVYWSFGPAPNYAEQSGLVPIWITPADATCTVSGYTGVYDGQYHAPTGSCTGLGGMDVSSGLFIYSAFRDVPGGDVHWRFSEPNYHYQSGDVPVTITPADATCTVSGYTGAYDGAAHGATGSCTGVNNVTLSSLELGETFTDVPGGDANWTFTDGNYMPQSGSVPIVITPADATCTISGHSGVYDGTAHGAAGSCTGVNDEVLAGLDLGGTFIGVPGGTANWTFTDVTGNYGDRAGSVEIIIDRAEPACTVTPYDEIYDALPHRATGECRGVQGEVLAGLDLGGTAHTDAGHYPADPWAYADVTGNYNNAGGTVVDNIDKADATCAISGWTGNYDGNAHGASGTCTGVDGGTLTGLDLGATFTNAPGGTAHWTFTDVTGNHGDQSGDVAIVITGEGNTAPVANPGGPYLGAVNTAIAFDGSGSSDPDGDPLTYAWTFGDDGAAAVATPTHSYAAAGIFRVCLTVNDGTVDSPQVCTLAVVYDPSAGFVTGGGWINSQAGAYKPDPTLSGQATFGFVSKYRKGATVPTGSTQFQFSVAGFNFYSETYEWLVVNQAGTNAQFKGSGLINGAADPNGQPYKFMLWAGDGSPDTFRIRIWWEDAGAETDVYDNGVEQAIGAGNIVVHTK